MLHDTNQIIIDSILIFVGLGAGFALSEIKEYRHKKKNIKRTKELLLDDIEKISLARTKNPIPGIRDKQQMKEYSKDLIAGQKHTDEIIINYHQRFDFSFWKGMLLTGAPLELEKEFFQNYFSYYERVEDNVNDMKREYSKAKRKIERELDKIKPDEFSIYLILFNYFGVIYARFFAIRKLQEKLPNDIRQRLEYAFNSGGITMKWSNLNRDAVEEGFNVFEKNLEKNDD